MKHLVLALGAFSVACATAISAAAAPISTAGGQPLGQRTYDQPSGGSDQSNNQGDHHQVEKKSKKNSGGTTTPPPK